MTNKIISDMEKWTIKDLLEIENFAFLNDKMKLVCFAYLTIRNISKFSIAKWANRFNKLTEWQRSDYEGRRVLQKIAPEIYPEDLNEYFYRTK